MRILLAQSDRDIVFQTAKLLPMVSGLVQNMKGIPLHQEERILLALVSSDHARLSKKRTLISLSQELDIPARVLNRTLDRMERDRLVGSVWSTGGRDLGRPERKRYFATITGLNKLTESQKKSGVQSNT